MDWELGGSCYMESSRTAEGWHRMCENQKTVFHNPHFRSLLLQSYTFYCMHQLSPWPFNLGQITTVVHHLSKISRKKYLAGGFFLLDASLSS
ncbi:hypothetical protein NC653_028493 [Populus alba x Populus x berolinensis]|uniref:Uncharacterized protein n=1 Tax=Populus alba x Populus x berolinensis TaxID=444605 RepID=A0AAD6LZY1_9ROSI|nr:hypothetical protein NC653_028493 [Populus alba x Populus x berolinensis]